MARRNLFQPPPPPAPAEDSGASRFPNTGAMTGMKATLRDMQNLPRRTDFAKRFQPLDFPRRTRHWSSFAAARAITTALTLRSCFD